MRQFLLPKVFSRFRAKRRRAVSSIIGAVLLFGILFSVGFGYFYGLTQDQLAFQAQSRVSANSVLQRNEESLYAVGSAATGTLSFNVNNTGIPTTLVSYFVSDQTGKIVSYASGNPTSATICSSASGTVACALNQGGSTVFNTNIVYIVGSTYAFRVVTNRGSVFVGTYPTLTLTSTSVSSVVASGLGSLSMNFATFSFYGYSQTGGPWKVNMTYPLTASISTYNNQIVLSATVTNNDPTAGTIVVDSHTDLWTFVSCSGGCGGQAQIFFYIMNVAANGTVTSANQGSYVPIQIPYGSTKTLYFGSSNDLSLGNFGSQSINDQINEHDVFLIVSGTLLTTKNATLYGQNLPFAATFASDNIGTWAQTPKTCPQGQTATFTLTVGNTKWSNTGGTQGISKVKVQAGAFASVAGVSTPAGWTRTVFGNGTILWSANAAANYIHYNSAALTFSWSGTAPTVTTGTQYTFPGTITFVGGTVLSQPIDTGCYVS